RIGSSQSVDDVDRDRSVSPVVAGRHPPQCQNLPREVGTVGGNRTSKPRIVTRLPVSAIICVLCVLFFETQMSQIVAKMNHNILGEVKMEQNRELPVILRADVTDAFTEPRPSGSGWTSPLPATHGSNEECVILARAKNNETE